MDFVARRLKPIILGLLALDYVFVNLAFYVGTQNIVIIKDVSAPFFSILILGLWISAEVYAGGGWRLRPSPLNAPLVAYLGWMAASLFWSPAVYASVFEIGRFASYFVMCLAVVRFVETWRDFRFLFLVHLATGAVVILYGASQLMGWDVLEMLGWIPGWGSNVFVSTHGNQNFVAAHIIITGSMALAYVAFSRSAVRSSLACAMFALVWYGVIKSTARGAYIGFGLSTLLVLGGVAWNRARVAALRSAAHRAAAKGLAVAAAAALVVGVLARPDAVREPFEIIRTEYVETMRFGFTGAYNYVRLIFWQGSMDLALKKPVGGWGIGTLNKCFPYFRPPWYHRHNVSHNTIYSHNEWVNNFAELGIVGVGILFWLTLTYGRTFLDHVRARREGEEYPLLLGLGGGMLAFLVQTTFDVETRWTGNAVTYWQTAGLLFAAAALPLARQRDFAPPPPSSAPRREAPLARHGAGLILAAAFLVGAVFYYRYAAGAFLSDMRLRDNMMITEAGQPGDPIRASEEARAGDPYSLTNYYKLAYSYLVAGRWDDALSTYRTLQFMAPNYAQVHLNLGVLFRSRGYHYESIWEIKRAATIEDNIRNHKNLADLYTQFGDYRRVIPHLRRTLRIYYDDDDGGGHFFLHDRETLLAGLADAYIASGRPRLAERQVAVALSLNPGHIPSLLHLARLLRATDPARSMEIVGQVLSANPNEPEALFFLGEAAMQSGDLRAAVEFLGRLARILPPGGPGDSANGRYAQAIFDAGYRALTAGAPGVDQAACLDMMGWAFAIVGRYDQALGRLAAAYEQTRDPRIAAHFAQVRALASR